MTVHSTSTWPPAVSRLILGIAENVKRVRRERKMSTRILAERLAETSVPMHPSVLRNLESGRRASVGVEELIEIAGILDVPPLLLLPLGPDGTHAWFTGPVERCEYPPGSSWIDSDGHVFVRRRDRLGFLGWMDTCGMQHADHVPSRPLRRLVPEGSS